ncbi:aspartate/methionine/tyrosine aminotransferase [Pseudorhizobium tarimense]|uniref:aspartate transaminase n=1 Tax=Pseudorhizobium tarimense TaxID=1079109 RepID=A0ABV2H929_9HYPH|nr:aminotransferase [Pseudorhizobium tarimense]MCJ8520097.1 aminotransferase [Pseudorhizobium tarimense]
MPPFNPLVQKLAPPPVPSVFAWGRSYDGSRGPLIDLSQAVPGYPPHPKMLELLKEMAGSTAYCGYGAIEGESHLRRVYAEHVRDVYGADIDSQNIHVTSGCNEAFISAATAVAGAGETVLMTNPFYFNHETTLAMMGVTIKTVDCAADDGFLPRVDAVAAAITPDVRALALVSPNNPTGAVYPADLLREIFEVCREKDIWLILDETYRDFLPDPGRSPHGLFDEDEWEDRLICLYSFSKSFCIPGHRLGAITAGAKAVEQIAKIMDNIQICAPRAAQAAVAQAMPMLADWREGNRQEIVRRAKALRMVIAQVPAWRIDAVGAYFAFVRHPFPSLNSAEVAERMAKQAGVICIPGMYFGPGQEQYLRFAFANADVPTIERLAERLENFAAE